MAIPGDIVRYVDREYVVVDIAGDDPPMAVLRAPDDMELLKPVAVSTDRVDVVGHLEHLDGWVEDSPGIWSQT